MNLRNFYLALSVCACGISIAKAQDKLIVGIGAFTKEVETPYSGSVTEKVVQVVTNTRRFVVLDRLSRKTVKDELELQKDEAFLDNKNTAKQGVSLAAEYMIDGNIVKLNIYKMKNDNGTVNGYRASTAFDLQVKHVETGKTTEAAHFQTDVSPIMLSPESAVNEALKSVDTQLNAYILKTFPLKTKISKILASKKDGATSVLIAGGTTYGFVEGNKITIEKKEMIDDKPYYSKIGIVKITKVAGEDFSECSVLEGGEEIFKRFNAGDLLTGTLIMK